MKWVLNTNVVSKNFNPVHSLLEHLDSHVVPCLAYRILLSGFARRISKNTSKYARMRSSVVAASFLRISLKSGARIPKYRASESFARLNNTASTASSVLWLPRRNVNKMLHGKILALVSATGFQECTVPSLPL
jgi:hypothetical protein